MTNQLGPLSVFGDTDIPLLSLPVPAGNYFVTAKVSLINDDTSDQFAHCTLSTGDISEARIAASNGSFTEQVIALEDSAAFSSDSTITLTCNTRTARAVFVRLAALEVGGIN